MLRSVREAQASQHICKLAQPMRRIATIVGLACFGLACLVVAAPASSGSARVSIAVSAAGPKPVLAKAQVAQPVTWTNATGVRHRVVWSGGRFPSFTLSPHGRHTLHFAAAGRYSYKVDGRKHGAVLVSAGGAATGGPGNPLLPTTWSGTIESDSQRVYVYSDGGGAQCNDHWHSDFSFTVQPGGTITAGTGKATLTSGPNCSGKFDTAGFATFPPAKTIAFSVSGSKQANGFTLTLGSLSSDGVSYAGMSSLFATSLTATATGPSLTIPSTGACAAGATVPTSFTVISDTLSSSNVFALTCKTS